MEALEAAAISSSRGMFGSHASSGFSSPRPNSPTLAGPSISLEDQIRTGDQHINFYPVPHSSSNNRLTFATPQVRTRPGSMRSQRWIIQPAARQGGDGDSRCGAEDEPSPPVVPLYMVTLDLAFAATFDVCTSALRHTEREDDNSVIRFFFVFLPVAWLWDHTNRFFNRFDQEDLVSELVVITIMGGAMMMSLNFRSCFYLDVLPSTSGDTEGTCVWLAAAYGGCRGVLSVLTAYVALYVPLARGLLWQELALWLFLGPCLVVLAYPNAIIERGSWRNEALFMIGWLADLLISLSGELPRRCTRRLMPNCATYRSIGLDGRYTIMRNERMVIIMLGSVCVNATSRAFNTLDSEFTWRAAAMCMSVPWAAFLIKTWYFDLCQVDLDTPAIGRHATEISTGRAAFWSLLHLPLIGCICWVSVSLVRVLVGPGNPSVLDPSYASYSYGDGAQDGAPLLGNASSGSMGGVGGAGGAGGAGSSLLGESLGHDAYEFAVVNAPHGRWQLAASFTFFIAIGTVQQGLHYGSGRGSRRCGKRRRMLIRGLGVVLLGLMQVPLAWLPANGWRDGLTVALDLLWLTILAATEVVGLRFVSNVPRVVSDARGCGASMADLSTHPGCATPANGSPRLALSLPINSTLDRRAA